MIWDNSWRKTTSKHLSLVMMIASEEPTIIAVMTVSSPWNLKIDTLACVQNQQPCLNLPLVQGFWDASLVWGIWWCLVHAVRSVRIFVTFDLLPSALRLWRCHLVHAVRSISVLSPLLEICCENVSLETHPRS